MKKVTLFCMAMAMLCAATQAQNKLVVNADQGKEVISKHIYGHFSEHIGRCIYGGIWVGENSPIPNTRGIRNDVVKALKDIQVPNLRWPGGCFADEYHWMNGIGPRKQRPKMFSTRWEGLIVEDNSFGTHEFLDLCEQLDCEPCICVNVASGTVEEMSNWVEYVTSDFDSPMREDENRQQAKAKGMKPVVPPKKNRKEPWNDDKELYKRRNEVERFNEFRRVFTRYDKPDIMYAAFVQFVSICQLLNTL
ncbi:hypothetical protein FACS189454_10130 [Planctomycetales bacterium]|nr:hypothetical protein FACS189454_10130 [Planctomycetales bacterium]